MVDKELLPAVSSPGTPAAADRNSSVQTVMRAFGTTALIAIGAVAYAHFSGGASDNGIGTGFLQNRTDATSDAERQRRIAAFTTQDPLALRPVEQANVTLAVDTMDLPPAAKNSVLTDAHAADPQTADVQAAAPSPVAAPVQSVHAATTSSEALHSHRSPLRLAWITLWDTDVEDGDVVRIDSQGYSRTVSLTKRGITFAVPVPADGIIRVTGINDGDGGGITVGLASGGAQAVFPIMSPGQSLGLRVAIK